MLKVIAIKEFLGAAWPIVIAILSFLIMIVVHEFGHFIAARATGVQVNEFSVGFGPKLFKYQGKKTLYTFRLIPFGGFCAMEGEDEASQNPNAFCNKKPWRRLIIIVAGALFNLIFGLIVVMIILAPSTRFATTKVAQFTDTAVSAQHGLQVEDEIVKVDGRKIYTTYDLSYAFTGIKDGKVDMDVRRSGKIVHLQDVQFATEEIDGVNCIRVDFSVYGKEKNFGSFISQAFKTTLSYARIVWFSLIDLIAGRFGLNAVSGPVGVASAMTSAVKAGWDAYLPLIALISINLGVFNLLPIPALDGSRALFVLFEMIFKKPVPQKKEALVHAVGFVILIGFMLIITAKDILKLFGI